MYGSRKCSVCETLLEDQTNPNYWLDRCDEHRVEVDSMLEVMLSTKDGVYEPIINPDDDKWYVHRAGYGGPGLLYVYGPASLDECEKWAKTMHRSLRQFPNLHDKESGGGA